MENVTQADARRQRVRENFAGLLLGLVLTYYFGSLTLSQFEHAAVLRDGQGIDARVLSARSFRGVIVAVVQYSGMAEGREIECRADVSLGYWSHRPKLGEQIAVSVRPGSCATPVSQTAIQWPWAFDAVSLLIMVIPLVSAVNLVQCVIPLRQHK
jgi:hypothetical protein